MNIFTEHAQKRCAVVSEIEQLAFSDRKKTVLKFKDIKRVYLERCTIMVYFHSKKIIFLHYISPDIARGDYNHVAIKLHYEKKELRF